LEIEKEIGEQIRNLRKEAGVSQMELAERIGVSFQQIQKYEKGATKISVFRLLQICEAFGVAVAVFFSDSRHASLVGSPAIGYGTKSSEARQCGMDKEELLFLKLFRRIRSKKIREGILQQLKGVIELEKRES